MIVETPAAPRRPRADARRNRERLIDTARAALADIGSEVTLDEIARRAGVGIGTLYRHFPTRDAMVEAVYRHEVEQLSLAATRLLETLPPAEALHAWMRLFVDYIARKKVMASALSALSGGTSELFATSGEADQGGHQTAGRSCRSGRRDPGRGGSARPSAGAGGDQLRAERAGLAGERAAADRHRDGRAAPPAVARRRNRKLHLSEFIELDAVDASALLGRQHRNRKDTGRIEIL